MNLKNNSNQKIYLKNFSYSWDNNLGNSNSPIFELPENKEIDFFTEDTEKLLPSFKFTINGKNYEYNNLNKRIRISFIINNLNELDVIEESIENINANFAQTNSTKHFKFWKYLTSAATIGFLIYFIKYIVTYDKRTSKKDKQPKKLNFLTC